MSFLEEVTYALIRDTALGKEWKIGPEGGLGSYTSSGEGWGPPSTERERGREEGSHHQRPPRG